MPELPEVETIRVQLEPLLLGRTVGRSWAFDSPKFTDATATGGATLVGLRRRGKYLLVDLDGPDRPPRELVIHLGMTGRLDVASGAWDAGSDRPGSASPQHLRAALGFTDGTVLRFHDPRRFGRLTVVAAGDHGGIPTLSSLGPEPFDPSFDAAALHASLRRSRRAVKTQLLGQRVIAGVGNIYADEALWRAGISPRATRLGLGRAERLLAAVREALSQGLEHGGTTLRDYRTPDGSTGANQHRLQCYGRAGRPCLRCGAVLVHSTLDGRGTTSCSRCQH